MINFFITTFFILNLLVFLQAFKKVKKEFYSDVFMLVPLGIYVWGDALVLAPFWMVSSLLFLFISTEMIVKYLLFFVMARSFFELIYWLNHQSANSDFNPPLFRKLKWIKPKESAILYQLMHMCVVIFTGFFLFVL